MATRMTDLYYIQDENLISARINAIDLEVEQACGELMAMLRTMCERADAAWNRMWLAEVERLEERLMSVLIHVWPSSRDPVVVELRAAASSVIDQASQLKARLFS
jgi:hypothetical protein